MRHGQNIQSHTQCSRRFQPLNRRESGNETRLEDRNYVVRRLGVALVVVDSLPLWIRNTFADGRSCIGVTSGCKTLWCPCLTYKEVREGKWNTCNMPFYERLLVLKIFLERLQEG